MPGTLGVNFGLVWGYSIGDMGWGISSYNPGFQKLDTILNLSVLASDLTAPPGGPVEGDRYIIASPATGDWAGHEGDVAAYLSGGWVFYPPKVGWRGFDEGTGQFLYSDGTVWATEAVGLSIGYPSLPAEVANLPVAFPFSGRPAAGQAVLVPVVQTTTIPADFTGTIGYSRTLATGAADFVLSLIHSGTVTSLGTVTFTGSGAFGTLSTQGSIVVPAGDILMFEAPSVQDPTLSDVGTTFLFKKG